MNQTPTVFVVDDDKAVRNAIVLLLKSEGLKVEAFSSGESFLEAYEPNRPGCLVLDISMPGMSGFDLQDTLVSKQLRIPIIFITGHGDIPMSVKALKAGAIDFLEKPFNNDQLLKCIRVAIAQDHQVRLEETQKVDNAVREYADKIVETVNQPMIVLDENLQAVSANRAFYVMFQTNTQELLTASFQSSKDSPLNIPSLRDKLKRIITDNIEFEEYDVTHDFPRLGRKTLLTTARLLLQPRNYPKRVLLVLQNITERKDSEERLRQAATVFENTNDAIVITGPDNKIISVNKAFTDITGYQHEEVIGKNPRVLKSGLHDQEYYKQLWDSLQQHGRWRGEIWNRRKNGEIFPAWENISKVTDPHGEALNYVSVFSDITAIKESEQRLTHLAHHDALTELPNRLLFTANLNHALERAKRYKQKVALLFLDLDRFKLINDTLGHAVGDRLLQAIATRLKKRVRAEDTVARLGGDEFTIILSEISNAEDAGTLAEKIIADVSVPVHIDDQEVVISTSIGISLYPQDADNSEDLARAADAAMYRAKDHGRNTYQYYSNELTSKALEHMSIEHGLRRALDRGEFVLYYQPQVALDSGKIVGVEALIRWQHPSMGIVLPTRFIKIAEDTGLINSIGEWVLRTACAQAKTWKTCGLPPIRVAVNLSGRQIFRDRNIVEEVQSALKESNLDPRFLVLEVTENILQTTELSINTLTGLKSLGVTLAIDDFGTGYSSLSSLQRLPIDIVKVDRSFVQDIPYNPNDEALAAAIISMGHNLNLRVVAEGAESKEQLAFLKKQGCDEMQGFIFSKPVLPELIHQFLQTGKSLSSELYNV